MMLTCSTLSSRQILGWPLFLLAAPIIAVNYPKNLHRRRNPLDQHGNRNVTEDTWVAQDFCLDCQRDRLHTFVQFADEPAVESECQFCLAVREREDRGLGQ